MLSQVGFEIVMVNCNLEMVFIDYDIVDRLYFELLMFEDVLEVYYVEMEFGSGGLGVVGVIVQFGGQILFGLVYWFVDVGVLIVGILLEVIDLVEDCGVFGDLLSVVGLLVLKYGIVIIFVQVCWIVEEIGYLVLVWLLYVFGGCGMEIVYDEEMLQGYIICVIQLFFEYLVFVDCFFEDVVEIDVDVLCDGVEVYIGGIMEYIEEVGIYFGDLVCVLLLVMLGCSDIEKVCKVIEVIVYGIGVVGLFNVQYVFKDDVFYVLEVNLRVSCIVLFVFKVIVVLFVKVCVWIMLGVIIVQLCVEGLLVVIGDGVYVV